MKNAITGKATDCPYRTAFEHHGWRQSLRRLDAFPGCPCRRRSACRVSSWLLARRHRHRHGVRALLQQPTIFGRLGGGEPPVGGISNAELRPFIASVQGSATLESSTTPAHALGHWPLPLVARRFRNSGDASTLG